jgi:hypothetical protein
MKATVLRMPAKMRAPAPALTITAPTMPPISPCEELLGMPLTQVTTWVSTMPGCTMLLPTLAATLK